MAGNINLRAAEALELIDTGRVEVVRVERSRHSTRPFPAAGAVVACREPWAYLCAWDEKVEELRDHKHRLKYQADKQVQRYSFSPASTMRDWAIRLHARVESRDTGQRDCKWFWVAVLVREEKSDGQNVGR